MLDQPKASPNHLQELNAKDKGKEPEPEEEEEEEVPEPDKETDYAEWLRYSPFRAIFPFLTNKR